VKRKEKNRVEGIWKVAGTQFLIKAQGGSGGAEGRGQESPIPGWLERRGETY
jgi:hypothetical protein